MELTQFIGNVFVGLAIITLVMLVVWMVFYIVPQQSAYIIERFGKFLRYDLAGFHFKIPLIDRIVDKVELRTQQLTFRIGCKTKDNVTIACEIAAQYKGEQRTRERPYGDWHLPQLLYA